MIQGRNGKKSHLEALQSPRDIRCKIRDSNFHVCRSCDVVVLSSERGFIPFHSERVPHNEKRMGSYKNTAQLKKTAVGQRLQYPCCFGFSCIYSTNTELAAEPIDTIEPFFCLLSITRACHQISQMKEATR